MNKDLISIIVPVYNAEKQLPKTLESVLKQTYESWELLLINDGSTDDTESIIKQYLSKDKRIRYFSQLNAGPSKARNKGIEEAQGIYLSFIDADDWVALEYLEKLIEPMSKGDVDLVCAGYYEINPQFPNGLSLHDFSQEQFYQTINKQQYQSNLFNGVSGVLWSKLFKKEIFSNNNIQLHPELRLSEDLLAVLEYSTYINHVYIIPYPLYYYNRLEEGGLSGRLSLSNYKGLKILIQEIEKYSNELSFIDLDAILAKRKYSFMVKLLKDNVYSKKEFYKVANFLVKNESTLDERIYQDHKINDKVLKWVFSGKYFRSWILLKLYNILRSIKNG